MLKFILRRSNLRCFTSSTSLSYEEHLKRWKIYRWCFIWFNFWFQCELFIFIHSFIQVNILNMKLRFLDEWNVIVLFLTEKNMVTLQYFKIYKSLMKLKRFKHVIKYKNSRKRNKIREPSITYSHTGWHTKMC